MKFQLQKKNFFFYNKNNPFNEKYDFKSTVLKNRTGQNKLQQIYLFSTQNQLRTGFQSISVLRLI